MVGVPLLTLVMPAREAAGMMLPVLLAMDAIAVYAYRKEVDWRIIRLMLPGAMVGTLIAWALWAFISDAAVLLFVGVVMNRRYLGELIFNRGAARRRPEEEQDRPVPSGRPPAVYSDPTPRADDEPPLT